MDAQMLALDGLAVATAIRAEERIEGRHLPIIAMTAHAMPEDRERCLAVGMDGYVAKPIQLRELLSAIGSVCPPGHASRTAQPIIAPADLAVDQAAMLAAVEGDMDLLRELAALFLDDYPQRMAELGEAIARQDSTRVARAAHILRGAVGNLGARDTSAAALSLEQAGWLGDLTQVPAAYATLKHEMQRLIPVLTTLALEPTS
jgi:HPt (histidine-containing phosphotransfer) domain-containing protein